MANRPKWHPKPPLPFPPLPIRFPGLHPPPPDAPRIPVFSRINTVEGEEYMMAGASTMLLLGLNPDVEQKDVLNYFQQFQRFAEEIDVVEIKRHPVTKRSCGYAMVSINTQDLHDFLINRKHLIKNSWVTALPSTPRDFERPSARIHPSSIRHLSEEELIYKRESTPPYPTCLVFPGPCTIYVGGFSIETDAVDEHTIIRYFQNFGRVEAVELPRFDPSDPDNPPEETKDEPPYSCGWALVLFADHSSADRALNFYPHYIDGVNALVHPTYGRFLDLIPSGGQNTLQAPFRRPVQAPMHQPRHLRMYRPY